MSFSGALFTVLSVVFVFSPPRWGCGGWGIYSPAPSHCTLSFCPRGRGVFPTLPLFSVILCENINIKNKIRKKILFR